MASRQVGHTLCSRKAGIYAASDLPRFKQFLARECCRGAHNDCQFFEQRIASVLEDTRVTWTQLGARALPASLGQGDERRTEDAGRLGGHHGSGLSPATPGCWAAISQSRSGTLTHAPRRAHTDRTQRAVQAQPAKATLEARENARQGKSARAHQTQEAAKSPKLTNHQPTNQSHTQTASKRAKQHAFTRPRRGRRMPPAAGRPLPQLPLRRRPAPSRWTRAQRTGVCGAVATNKLNATYKYKSKWGMCRVACVR